jgi:hypothetical protein
MHVQFRQQRKFFFCFFVFFASLAACTSLYIQRSVLPYTQRALFLFCFLLGCFSRSAIHHPNSSTFHHTGTFVQVSTLESRCCRTRLVQTVLVLWRALARALSLHVWVIVSISQVPPHALAPWHTHARTHTHTHTHTRARARTHTHTLHSTTSVHRVNHRDVCPIYRCHGHRRTRPARQSHVRSGKPSHNMNFYTLLFFYRDAELIN